MKRALLLATCLLASVHLFADTEVIGPFGSLNNNENSFIIPSNMSPDLLNVDISDGNKSVRKRKGYGTAFTLSNSTSPVHGVYNFYDSNGSDVSLIFNDRRMNVSVSGASPTVFFSTGTNSATYQCVDSAGFAYCANTSRDSIIKVNSSTYSILSGLSSIGTMVAITPERLVQAGFAANTSLVWFSKANDFTTWTTGGNATDPIQFTITSQGSGIKHITYAHGRVYWFKDASFGYILAGQTQADWRVVTVNSFIGNIYNTSIFRDDVLYFQGNDGHFYAFDGTNLVKLSKDISATIALTQGRTSNSWTQSTQSDFSGGVSSGTSFNSLPGSVVLDKSTPYVNYSSATSASGGFSACFAPYYISSAFIPSEDILLSSITVRVSTSGTTSNYILALKSDNNTAPGSNLIYGTVYSTGVGLFGTNYTVPFSSTYTILGSTRYWVTLIPTAASPCTGGNAMTWLSDVDATAYYSTGTAIQQGRLFGMTVHGSSYTTGGYYNSAVKNSPQIVSWDAFGASLQNVNGAHSFFIRSSTGVFYASATTPSWTSVSNGAIPTISTNPYFQIRDVMTTSSKTTTPILDSFTQSWFEGGASDKTYAVYHDNSNWWSVASGTGATTNNKILKFNLINPGWTIYDIGMGGMYIRSQFLYFGSVSSGKVFKFGDQDSDDGSSIQSYWKSKDFFGSVPFLDKDYSRISSAHPTVSNSTMTITYTLDGNSSTSYSVNLGSSTSSFMQKNINLPQGKIGKTINIQYGNTAADQPWEVFGGAIEYNNKPWVPK